MYLFRVMVEVTTMEGSQLPFDCAGAFVNVYLRARHIKDAIDDAEAQLLEDKYKPVRTIDASSIDIEDLTEQNEEYREEGDPRSNDLVKIFDNGGHWYAAFHLFPNDEGAVH